MQTANYTNIMQAAQINGGLINDKKRNSNYLFIQNVDLQIHIFGKMIKTVELIKYYNKH